MSTTAETLPTNDSTLWPRIGWWVMAILAVLSFFYAASVAFHHIVLGVQDIPEHNRMFSTPFGAAHVFGGAIATLIGPFQFLGSLRKNYPRVHRWLGRIYLTSVGLSALGGLYLSPGSDAANTFGIAFICLALAWLYTGIRAYLSIRRRDVNTHKQWMIRNYALTYAFITLRIQMPLLIISFNMDPIMALNIVGWTCWVPSLVVVEMFMNRGRKRKTSGVRDAL